MKKFVNVFNLKYIYFIVFSSLIAWAFFAYFTMNTQILNQEIYAKIINLSGKQRMLSQKTTLIAKRYFESKDENLKTHLKELINLMKEDYFYISNNLTSKEVCNIYFSPNDNLDKKVKNYFELVEQFYKSNNLNLLKEIEKDSFELLPLLDKAVYAFQKESDEKTAELLKREKFILFGTILTILLEALFIVIPSIRISVQKEKELNELNASLKTKIDEAIKENLEKEKIIQQQFHFSQMEEVIVNVSHQWRQLLSVISTIASSIKISNEELTDKIDIIMSKVDYLSNTINNFNEFIKIDEILENIKLHKTINKTLFVLDSSLKTNNININKDFYKDEIFIVGNSTKLSQALLSIFNNARDFLITNQIENKEIHIKTYVENSFIFIEIEDNAGGIKQENLKKVFDIYFTTKHQSQGTGLGLYITYHIIKKYFKGTVEAKNGQFGAKFIIKLPLE
ncbi:MAG: HAMP domain-containing sensor histidine kinase [Arcobacter sp.]|jgi:signal transduction histidine kinase|uniref:sensor histidine kinase n=1 Tax=Arcobacter sp. TaxID=1872629 RepID=UPI002589B799|nr:HAMP domain-containing sensor histidine kinase [Arcobacter sp.]MDD3008289.1 HAMP domain-containing sensor histidine kinase [Arcobacter sp.]MDY3204243.1 HAMP domain-containing sensor histidine kinase [Arcobacter sp.]